MPQVHINYAAVVIAAVVPMILGAVWYAPPVFGTVWMQLVGKRPEDLKTGTLPQAYALMFVSALVLSFVLAHVLRWAGAATVVAGIRVALTMWIGLVLTTSAGGFIFEGRPAKLYWLQNGYHGVTMVIMGIILAVWV